MQSSPSAAVVVEGLVKTFGDTVRALDGVSFAIPEGTVLGLLGPNGAGKTTVVRILTTLLKPDSGRVQVAGVDVLADPARARSVIGLAGQYAAVDEALTGFENLTLVGSLNHLPRSQRVERARELLDQFGLSDAADRPLKTYSGGMRRRLDLAAALVARPPVLFLDEPTTGLDPRSRIDLWVVIQQLVADGTTLLLTTQYLEEADRLADQICVVDHGRVIAEGTSSELKSRLGGTVVEVSFADDQLAVRAEGVLESAGDSAPVRDAAIVRVGTTSGPATLAEVVRRLDTAGIEPEGMQLRQPSLDDVFLSLTGHGTGDDGDGGDQRRSRRRKRRQRAEQEAS